MVKAYPINLTGPSRSNLSHHPRSAQSMVVGGTTTSMRMLGGPILLGLTRGSQRPQTDPQFEQEQLLVLMLSEATSPQVQIETLQPQLGILEEDDEFEEFPASDEFVMC